MTNFDWTRDELLLALDVYFGAKPHAPSPKMPEVRRLSQLLRNADFHPLSRRPENFRSPASVVMKLMNFRRLDPEYEGKGLSAGSNEDRNVWEEFSPDSDRLTKTTKTIRNLLDTIRPVGGGNDDSPFYVEGSEGQLLTRLHRDRERAPILVKRKKTEALQRLGYLACEACGFSFASAYGERGVDYIECHHITPLSTLEPGRRTRLDDLALLCANCHRMIHSQRPWLSLADLRKIIEMAPFQRNPNARGAT